HLQRDLSSDDHEREWARGRGAANRQNDRNTEGIQIHQVRSGAMVNKIVRGSFVERDPLTCAREVIGTELIWGDCSGIVVEVEAYAAINDEAAHTFTRPSARSFIERNNAGAAYVYFNYGMHWMLNVLVKGDENG